MWKIKKNLLSHVISANFGFFFPLNLVKSEKKKVWNKISDITLYGINWTSGFFYHLKHRAMTLTCNHTRKSSSLNYRDMHFIFYFKTRSRKYWIIKCIVTLQWADASTKQIKAILPIWRTDREKYPCTKILSFSKLQIISTL